jgi:hypothetical protein
VTRLRALALRFPAMAALVVAAALLLRVAVPAGFMPVVEDGRFTVLICSGAGPVKAVAAMPGMDHATHHRGEAEPPKSCAFSDLSLQALGGADPIQLADAIRYAFAAALVLATALPVVAAAHLRPPLRGPPVPA